MVFAWIRKERREARPLLIWLALYACKAGSDRLEIGSSANVQSWSKVLVA